ncbi:MAG: hypothetical protein P8J33_11135, partial [Pirellulaceae bacterium]|nr:hypothetical protein [Pirellulaceae bacterium]
RFLLLTMSLVALISMPGCVLGPRGGCGQCNTCDGFVEQGQIHNSPIDSFRAWRRGLTCSVGCGETYWDEWYSTPPDCVDPCPGDCCETGFVDCGCAGPCGCDLVGGYGGHGVRPLELVSGLLTGLYGKRFCGACGYDFDECGCGGGGGGYMEGQIIDGGEYIEGPIIQGTTSMMPTSSGGGSNCATGNCAANAQPNRVPVAKNSRRSPAYQQAMARQRTSAPNNANARSRRAVPNQVQGQNYRQATRMPTGPAPLRR